MVTLSGPVCDHCHFPLNGQYYRPFFFCHFQYCSLACLRAAERERERRRRAEEFKIARHKRRYWRVTDGNGEIVCVAVYKKGAEEVVRRLNGRRPPPFRPETGASVKPTKHKPATAPSTDAYQYPLHRQAA